MSNLALTCCGRTTLVIGACLGASSLLLASVSMAGDLHGDGFDDLAVGSPTENLDPGNLLAFVGAASIISGSEDGLDPTCRRDARKASIPSTTGPRATCSDVMCPLDRHCPRFDGR